MAKFKDNEGREWVIPHFDPYNVADVEQATGVSIYTITQRNLEPLRDLFGNRPVFWNVVFILVGEQAKERGVSDRQFVQAVVGGDCLDAAQEAFWEEVLFFSQKAERELLIQMMAKARELQATVSQKITTGMTKLFGDLSASPDSNPAA
jgi:hypothetical protein